MNRTALYVYDTHQLNSSIEVPLWELYSLMAFASACEIFQSRAIANSL